MGFFFRDRIDFSIPEKMPSNHVHSEMDYIGCEEQPDITGFKIHESRFGQS